VLRASEEGLANADIARRLTFGGHRTELPVGVDREAGRDESHRSRPPRPPARLVV